MTSTRWNRRTFFKASAALSLPMIVPAHVLGTPQSPGANERIRIGLIGPGFRARDLLKESPPDLEYVSLADCDLRQIAAYKKWAAEALPGRLADKCPQYQDYREMFDKEKLDGVIVATTTHARALICLHAMQAGLDVYAEKPLTLTIEEGQYLVRAERKYSRVFQTGTQQRSIPINNFGSDLVKNGSIGRVLSVECPNFLGPELRSTILPSEPTPAEMDWDQWCHQTPLVPYSPSLHPGLGLWGRWRDYDGGGLGWGVTGWGAHAFDQVQRALGTDDTDPEKVWPEGEGPNCPVTLRYPGGTLLKLILPQGKGPGLGAIFVGEKGKIEINRNRLASNPAELVQGAPIAEDRSEVDSIAERHIQNWVDCMRTRHKPVAHAEIGHRTQVICHLVNICRELGRPLEWDPVKEEFLADDEANRLRSRPRRPGYELPELG
ncbi:MAG: Gfo/Idh/MocA family protein [Pirellulaceae bacterium]